MKVMMKTMYFVTFYTQYEQWRRLRKIGAKGLLSNWRRKESCGNWRGLTLITVSFKVMGRIIIKRIIQGSNNTLMERASRFQKWEKRACTTEHIFVLRNSIEQSLEWNSSLYIIYICASWTLKMN